MANVNTIAAMDLTKDGGSTKVGVGLCQVENKLPKEDPIQFVSKQVEQERDVSPHDRPKDNVVTH